MKNRLPLIVAAIAAAFGCSAAMKQPGTVPDSKNAPAVQNSEDDGLTGTKSATTTPEFKGYVPSGVKPQSRFVVTTYYNDTCGKCHGMSAEGGGGGTPSLITRDKYDQKWDRPFFDAIKNGVKNQGMEAYDNISDSEIWSMVVHIRELQKRGLREKFGAPKATEGVYTSQYEKFKVETVIEQTAGLDTPWSIDWLPDGKTLVINKPTGLFVWDSGVLTKVEGTPAFRNNGQGGMMEVAVHPDYKSNGWIYLSLADPGKDGNSCMTKIVRGKLKFDPTPRWTDEQTIWKAPDSAYNGSGVHFGSKIVFDGKGHVFFTVGSRGAEDLPKDTTLPNGKVMRVNDDGTIPSDNPFVGTDEAQKAVWSYGHRNPQGLAIDLDGRVLETEHAPRGGDELNEITKGTNYGWNQTSFGINYNDSPLSVPWPTKDQKFQLPLFRWLPSVGTSGLDVVRGGEFKNWKGDIFAGGLAGQDLDRFRLKDGKLVEYEEILQGQGRVRDVAYGPDGYIYVVMNRVDRQTDRVIRLVPVK